MVLQKNFWFANPRRQYGGEVQLKHIPSVTGEVVTHHGDRLLDIRIRLADALNGMLCPPHLRGEHEQ